MFAQFFSCLNWICLLVQLVLALLYCFWGYRFFRKIISFYAFFIAFPLMLSVMSATSASFVVSLIVSLIVALLASLLAWAIYKVGVFLCGGILGISIAMLLGNVWGPSMMALTIIVGIILFVALGILAVKFQKGIIIFCSSVYGGFSLCACLYYLIWQNSAVASLSFSALAAPPFLLVSVIGSNYTLLIVPIVLSVLGIIVQAKSNKAPAASNKY